MTVKIAGYWDSWFSHRESEYDISWRFMLKHFGVDEAILIPNCDARHKIPLDNTDTPMREMNNINEVLASTSELTPVFIDERGTTPLHEFTHPQNALYIFGRTGFAPLDGLSEWSGHTVVIESIPKLTNTAGWLHPNQACAIVLYDRLRKSWQ